MTKWQQISEHSVSSYFNQTTKLLPRPYCFNTFRFDLDKSCDVV